MVGELSTESATAAPAGRLSRFVPSSTLGRVIFAIVALGGLAAGIAVGRAYAYSQSVGGLTAAFSAIWFGFLLFGLLVFGIVASLVARIVRAPAGSGRRLLVLAGVFAFAGVLLGDVTAAATGGLYGQQQPTIYEAAGSTEATIESGSTTFVPRHGGEADCHSAPDSTFVGGIIALDLGELGPGTLRAIFEVPTNAAQTHVEIFIDGADVGPDEGQPTWTGSAEVAASGIARTGTITFTNLGLYTDSKLPAPVAPWDAPISGSISWECQDW